MASLLASLAPVEVKQKEIKVDGWSPTKIADVYIKSKINSVRMALLRGYEVPEQEVKLIEELSSSSRSEAHKKFIQMYSHKEYMPLNGLNRTYEYVGNGSVVGENLPSSLSFVFYTSEGPNEDDVPLIEQGEVILIGLTDVTRSNEMSIRSKTEPLGIKLVTRLVHDMSLWVIDHPLAPKAILYKQGYGLEEVLVARGVSSASQLEMIKPDDAFGRVFGIEIGDYLVETGHGIDPSAIAKRRVTIRYCSG